MGTTYVKSHWYKEGRQDQSENSVSFSELAGQAMFLGAATRWQRDCT